MSHLKTLLDADLRNNFDGSYNIVPEATIPGIVQRPVVVTVGPFGTILVLNQGQVTKSGRVLKA